MSLGMPSNTPKDKQSSPEETGELSSERKSTGNLPKIMIIFVAAAIIIILLVLVVGYARGKGNKEVETAPSDTTSVATPMSGAEEPSKDTSPDTPADPAVVGDAGSDAPWLSAGSSSAEEPTATTGPKLTEPSKEVVPGISDPSADQYVKNYTKVSPDTFVKDLNGKNVETNYDIGQIRTEVDFVSYTKKRASTDVGIELYWLEATYKGKKAKIQVPFRIFKELDPVGVTVVDVEYVEIPDESDYTKDPARIVTGFTVRDDYKQLLKDASR